MQIDPSMRQTLFVWLEAVSASFSYPYQLASKYSMKAQTLQLAYTLTDVFLSNLKTIKDMLQLEGVTALLIAYKV